MTTTETITFEPPGPGDWMLDTTHHGRRPVTRIMQPINQHAFDIGMPTLFAKYGIPLDRSRIAWVHGCGYLRLMAVGEPEKPGKPPPALVMKVIARVHPEMRRRAKAAKRALAERTWRTDTDAWFDHDRERIAATNRAFQEADLVAATDEELVAHVDALLAHATACAADSFIFHGGDIVPVGLFTAACIEWGIDPDDSATLLKGASPATMEVDQLLAPVSQAIADAGVVPSSIEQVRALGAEVESVIDEWLANHGWRLLASDDIDSPTLAERPDLQLRAICSAQSDRGSIVAPDVGPVRDRVPAAERPRFDDLLTEARYGPRLRDDHVGIRWNWPAGLIRRALLEVGRRLTAEGRAHVADHAIELEAAEVASALAGHGPSADDLAARSSFRDAVELAGPPSEFSSGIDAEPPFECFPEAMATMAKGVFAVIAAMEGASDRAPHCGHGIGSEPYRGRACVARSAMDAADTLEAGDVLIVPFTSPSYNSLFPLVGSVVTEEGGPLSHAAIMAREFGVPAIVGAPGVTDIPHGATVEVDPTSGVVRVVA